MQNRYVIMFVFLGLVVTSSISAGSSIEEESITVSSYDTPLEEVVKDIDGQTEYKIILKNRVVRPVTIELDKYPLEKGIKRLLAGLNYFIIRDDAKKELIIDIIETKAKPGQGNPAGKRQATPFRRVAPGAAAGPKAEKGSEGEPEPLPRMAVTTETEGPAAETTSSMSELAVVQAVYEKSRKSGLLKRETTSTHSAANTGESSSMSGLARSQAMYDRLMK